MYCFPCKFVTLNSGYLCHRYSYLGLKGGYLDFSHLTELMNIYITEIYMKKQYNSSISMNHKFKKKSIFYDGILLKGYVAS